MMHEFDNIVIIVELSTVFINSIKISLMSKEPLVVPTLA